MTHLANHKFGPGGADSQQRITRWLGVQSRRAAAGKSVMATVSGRGQIRGKVESRRLTWHDEQNDTPEITSRIHTSNKQAHLVSLQRHRNSQVITQAGLSSIEHVNDHGK
jgi:hypothetical protein